MCDCQQVINMQKKLVSKGSPEAKLENFLREYRLAKEREKYSSKLIIA